MINLFSQLEGPVIMWLPLHTGPHTLSLHQRSPLLSSFPQVCCKLQLQRMQVASSGVSKHHIQVTSYLWILQWWMYPSANVFIHHTT